MFKGLIDRLAFAFIGFVLGTIVAAILWFFYGAGFTTHAGWQALRGSSLGSWVRVVGGLFAAIGFIAKDGVGDALGGTVREVHDYETSFSRAEFEVPRWLLVLVVVGAVGTAWYVARH